MGRVKLKIKRLENTNGRQATYSKRKNGILKKASELSILCDIDIILLMFSPSGKPSLCSGRRSNFEEVITKFAHMTPQERAKRKLESLEALRKTFKRLNHDINIQELLGTSSSQATEDLSNQSRLLQTLISERNKRLSHWIDPSKISNVEKLEQMENSLKDSLNQIRSRKENMQKQQLASMQWNSQFNEMHNPFRMITEQHLSPLSWIANGDSQNMVLPEDSKLLLHKDIEGTASCSFGSYASYLGSSTKTDITNLAQENGVLSDLSSTAPVRLQLNGNFPYQPYNFSLQNDMKFQPAAEMNTQENHHVDYHVNGRFEAPRPPPNESDHHGWNPTSGPCATTMFDEYLFGQASFPQAHFGFS